MSTQSFPNRLAEGTPGGGRFTFGRFSEPDMTFGHDGVAVDVCPTCDGPSDQDGGIPCSTCLDSTCACGAGLDDGEGYNGQCGSCADRADNEDEADREADAAQARARDLTDPIEGSEEWQAAIKLSVGREIRNQCPDAVAWNYVIDDDNSASYDSLVHVTLADGSKTYVDLARTEAADVIAELSSYDSDFGTLDTYENHNLPPEAALVDFARVLNCEPERLHPSMGDGPIVTSPSGRYGFYRPVNGRGKREGLAKHGPIVAVAQLINGGTAWSPTPARLYADSVTDLAPGSKLAIDLGAGWALSDADTAAFAKYSRQVKAQAAASDVAASETGASEAAASPAPAATDRDKEIAQNQMARSARSSPGTWTRRPAIPSPLPMAFG